MQYSCLILDHDDTVVRSTVQMHYPAYLHTMALLRPNVTPLTCEEFQQACDHPGLMALYEHTYGFTKEELAFELEDWRRFVKETVPDAFAGLDGVLTAYRQAGGIIVVVSHSDEQLIQRDYLHHFGFLPHKIYDLSYPNNKPDPHPVKEVMKTYGLTSRQVLVVDDLPIGKQMADRAGVDFAYAGWSCNPPSIHERMTAQCAVWLQKPQQLADLLLR